VVTSLAELQAAFQDHLLNGSSGVSQAVLANGGLDVARRLNIYHHAYRARLVDALRDSYGHTASYLGDEQFDAVARAYLAAHPSFDPNLRWFGASFSQWAAAEHAADPELSELAALDWALRRAFDASDATPLALSELARVPPEAWASIGFVFHPTCARLVLRHNTLAIWHALDQDAAPPAAEPLAQPSDVLIWRHELQPHFRSLGDLEASALSSLSHGESFAATCAALAAASPDIDVVAQAGHMLRRWAEDGLLAGATSG
jgi:hypothetical protein